MLIHLSLQVIVKVAEEPTIFLRMDLLSDNLPQLCEPNMPLLLRPRFLLHCQIWAAHRYRQTRYLAQTAANAKGERLRLVAAPED